MNTVHILYCYIKEEKVSSLSTINLNLGIMDEYRKWLLLKNVFR